MQKEMCEVIARAVGGTLVEIDVVFLEICNAEPGVAETTLTGCD